MFKWFKDRKPDHPLADAARAQELLAALPVADAPTALEEIVKWTGSVLRTEGFPLEKRIGVVKRLDEAGQPFHRKVLRDYLAASRTQQSHEQRLWNAAFGFWKHLTAGYAACLAEAGEAARTDGRRMLPLAVCRGIRAAGQQLKWLQLRYGPIDDDLWTVLSAFYRFALERSLERQALDLYPNVPGATDAQREMVKVLMLWATSPDTLSPMLLEIAERLTVHFSPYFEVERGRRVPGCYAFDLDGSRAPGRLMSSATLKPSMMLFGAGTAPQEMEKARPALEQGTVPPEIGLGGIYPPEAVLAAMSHLSLHWAPIPPERKHLRHRVHARLAVVNGLDRLIDEVVSSGSLGLDGIESWVIEDISASGFRASIPEMKPDWIRVGAVIGIRPEGVERWGLGIIRRLSRDRENRGQVGVQTLAHETVSARLRPASGSWWTALRLDAEGYLPALHLRQVTPDPGDVVVATRPGLFSMEHNLEMLGEHRRRLLVPITLMERAEEFEIARFREMRREEA